MPATGKIAAMMCREHPLHDRMLTAVQAAARAGNISLYSMLTEGTDELTIDRAFATMAQAGVRAVVGLPCAIWVRHRRRIAELALKARLPTIFEWSGFPEAGGLMSYGANTRDMWRLSATYVDRILKGASPRALPVQQPTRFDLVINASTAKRLGLTLPPSLLLRADRIIACPEKAGASSGC